MSFICKIFLSRHEKGWFGQDFKNFSVYALDKFWLMQHELFLFSIDSSGLEKFSTSDRFLTYTEFTVFNKALMSTENIFFHCQESAEALCCQLKN